MQVTATLQHAIRDNYDNDDDDDDDKSDNSTGTGYIRNVTLNRISLTFETYIQGLYFRQERCWPREAYGSHVD